MCRWAIFRSEKWMCLHSAVGLDGFTTIPTTHFVKTAVTTLALSIFCFFPYFFLNVFLLCFAVFLIWCSQTDQNLIFDNMIITIVIRHELTSSRKLNYTTDLEILITLFTCWSPVAAVGLIRCNYLCLSPSTVTLFLGLLISIDARKWFVPPLGFT